MQYLAASRVELSEAFLRATGYPDLLRMANAINGPDFTPFTNVLFVKEPGLGASVASHQDGQIHWDSPDWNEGIHGFNYQVQLYGSTPENWVSVVPGSHKQGKIDILAPVEANGGSERPTNRQTLHGSFVNTSPDRRITINIGSIAISGDKPAGR